MECVNCGNSLACSFSVNFHRFKGEDRAKTEGGGCQKQEADSVAGVQRKESKEETGEKRS